MSLRGLGTALALAVLGGGGGYAAGQLLETPPTAFSAAAPVPASSPSIPVDPNLPYARDMDYPALSAGLDYRKHRLGSFPYEWSYRAPKSWEPYQEGVDEIRWRPADEPTVGGFSMRVKLSTEHKSTEAMVAQKATAMLAGYQDVTILGRTDDLLAFSYRDAVRNVKRFNTFRWFALPGETEARFEMSVVGREVDRVGLDDLLEQVARGVTKLP